MPAGHSSSSECVVGFLQKKGRFYSWKRALFVLYDQGLIQLLSDQHSACPDPTASSAIPSTSYLIGDAGDIDIEKIPGFKQKQRIALHQLSQVVGQGQRDIVITLLDSSTLVLRAQSSNDCGIWLTAIRSAVAAAAVAGYAAEYPDHDVTVDTVDEGSTYPNESAPLSLPAHTSASRASPPRIADLDLPAGFAGASLARSSTDLEKLSHAEVYTIKESAVDEDVARRETPMGWLPSTSSLQNFGNEIAASGFLPESTSTKPATSHVVSHDNTNHDLDQSVVHIARDIGSFDVDALFDDDNSQIDGSRSSGELPLAVLASRTGELYRSKLAVNPSIPKELNKTRQTLHSVVETSTAVNDLTFDGMFDTLLHPAIADSPESKRAALDADISFSRLNLDSSATEMPYLSTEAKQRQTNSCVEQRPSIPNFDGRLDAPEIPNTVNRGSKTTNTSHSVTQQKQQPLQQQKQQTYTSKKDSDANGSMLLINTSVADFAGSLFDDICLGSMLSTTVDNTSLVLKQQQNSNSSSHALSRQNAQNSDHSTPNDNGGQTGDAGLEGAVEDNRASKLLNSPGRSRIDNQVRMAARRSVMTIYGGLGVSAQQEKQKPVGPNGIQMSLLAKYSDSLNASRTLLASGLRNNKGAAAHAWGSRANLPGGVHNLDRPATIVQYESNEPKNTGIRKVVRGQFAKDLIQKESERKPAVRRMRRVKSESKVLPLKSIRLRLNGSIVGGNTSINSGAAANDSSFKSTTGHQLPAIGSNTAPKKDTDNSSSKVGAHAGSAGAFGEFNTIRERLRAADEQKKLQQQAQMLDHEGVDDVRIGDIMQTRQDIPLAMQLEDKRRVQEAKRLALLSQQLEHQKQQLNIQRLNVEQQQQYHEFKRQSLCPTTHGPDLLAQPPHHMPQKGWTGHENNAYGGSDSYTKQWVQSQTPRFSSAMQSPYPQGVYSQNQTGMRPVSSVGLRPASYMSAMADEGGYMQNLLAANTGYPDSQAMSYEQAHLWRQQQQQQQQQQHYMYGSNHEQLPIQYAPPNAPNTAFSNGQSGRPSVKAQSSNKKRQPGAAFVKHGRSASAGGKSDNSNASTESWQSNVGRSARSSIHAKTEPVYEGSIYVLSPVTNSTAAGANANAGSTKKRASSFGQAEHRRRLMAKRVSATLSRSKGMDAASGIPPVPPLPQNMQQYQYQPHGQHQYQQQQHQYYVSQQMPGGEWGAHNNYAYPGNQQDIYADMQTLAKKRNEMSSNVPSLLQQLNQARATGVLPNRHKEKASYTKGAYQNFNTSQLIRDGTTTSAQYLGDGNTLLIDQAYEAEKSRTALLKRISHTYRGIGRESAPAQAFMH
ncbi:hypothetical protein GGH99_003987 [Coemansia sp. RSA 1285]|nr:hypothetical protein GGH99_003987 [Coemansia sp. RSA 1285]